MAKELQADWTTGVTVYFTLRNSVGQIWNGSAFEAYTTANYSTYKITGTEQGTASGYYTGDMPSVTAGSYNVEAKQQSGGSPAETDKTVGVGNIAWTGSAVEGVQTGDSYAQIGINGANLSAIPKTGFKLASDGLDSISVTAPTGVASTFPQMVNQLWRRFFKKATLTSTQLKTYADDGTTVITTQTLSDDGTTQTENGAT